MFEVLAGLYLLVIILVLLPTVSEIIRMKKPSLLVKLSGFLACLFWPVTLVMIFIDAQRHRRAETE